jgi:glycosyltransferase A (GT-A) superfamily protein (DUF2064 family)
VSALRFGRDLNSGVSVTYADAGNTPPANKIKQRVVIIGSDCGRITEELMGEGHGIVHRHVVVIAGLARSGYK